MTVAAAPSGASGGAAAGSVAAAAAGSTSSVGYAWKRTLSAIDEAVTVMAMPNTRVPLQVGNTHGLAHRTATGRCCVWWQPDARSSKAGLPVRMKKGWGRPHNTCRQLSLTVPKWQAVAKTCTVSRKTMVLVYSISQTRLCVDWMSCSRRPEASC